MKRKKNGIIIIETCLDVLEVALVVLLIVLIVLAVRA